MTIITDGLRRLGQRAVQGIGKHLDRRAERGHWRQWLLLIGRRSLAQLSDPDPATLTPLLPPAGHFWADPFLWQQDGLTCVFCEELPRATGIGRISVLTLDDALRPTGPAQAVLAPPWHLSYPFLFAFDGALYMVPESARQRRVDLYRCEQFPHRWVRLHSLLVGIEAADATLFPHAGRWWLLCAARSERARMNGSLFAFHADSPLSRRWTPHSHNPLVNDLRRGRPAGRVLPDASGRLLRPSQDCMRRYGHGLNIQEIQTLTPDAFAERRLWHGSGPACGGWQAMHHLDWHQGLLVMDAQRLLALAPLGPPG